MTQVLADIRTLLPTDSTKIDEQIRSLSLELNELKPALRALMRAFGPIDVQHSMLQARRKLLPGNRKLAKEARAVAETWADAKLKLDSASEQFTQLKQRIEKLQIERRAAELRVISEDYDFLAPFNLEAGDDPLVIATLMSAICESLQYQYISGNRYYHWLIDQVAKRGPNGEVSHGDTENSPGVPEIEDQWNDKLDVMRKKREHLTVLRMAAERAFNKILPELPENAPFIPKMLRKTDEELEQQLTQRNAMRWQEKRQEQAKVADAEHAHARREDKAYKPRL